ncbi:MAG: glycosyltransferase [Bacteroidota bacterium]|nr:glycosyltransferase [Bacteroidota bacterium]
MKEISIITVVRNDKKGLRNTYNSLRESLSDQIEWVIIDGKSNDGTLEVIQELPSSYLKWISEIDKNMYDAMNKGIKKSSGRYLLFLNAGDILKKNLSDINIESQSSDLIFYNIEKLDANYNKIYWRLPRNFLNQISEKPIVPHQSTFIKRDVFDKVGLYNDEFVYLGDYDFFCRVVCNEKNKFKYKYFLGCTIASFVCNGITFNYRYSLRLMKECMQIQKKYFNRTNKTMRILYIFKYLSSYMPGHLLLANHIRKFLKN